MKKKQFARKSACAFLSLSMLASMTAACSKEEKVGSDKSTPPAQQATKAGASVYPIVDKPLTLTMWVTLRKASASMQDFNQKVCFQEMEKATGIHIEFKHPATSGLEDQFNMMVASNDLPDIIWKTPDKAIANKFLVPLNDLVEKHAPNYNKLLNKYPNFKKAMYTDESVLTGFGYCLPYLEQNLIGGPMLRRDWLERLGLKVPETIDDWEKVLTAFKEKDPNGNGIADEIPFDGSKNAAFLSLATAWGVKNDFYLEGGPQNGKVKYGPMEPGFKSFITKMNDWYQKGLINPEYPTTDQKKMDTNMTTNKTGATFGGAGAYLGTYTGMMLDSPDFLLWPTAMPKLNSSSKAYGDIARGWSLSAKDVGYITTSNKHVVETVKWFDWGYSEKGEMALNFGKEGVTYNMADKYPVFTDEIFKNPKGLSTTNALAAYAMSADEHAVMQRPEVVEQIQCSTPAQRQATKDWGKGITDSPEQNLMLPPITLKDSEMTDDTNRTNDIKKYVSTMIDNFVIGKEPLANYDNFIKQLRSMGVEESIKVRQEALERWKTRGNIPFDPKVERYKLNFKNAKLITEKGMQYLDADLK